MAFCDPEVTRTRDGGTFIPDARATTRPPPVPRHFPRVRVAEEARQVDLRHGLPHGAQRILFHGVQGKHEAHLQERRVG